MKIITSLLLFPDSVYCSELGEYCDSCTIVKDTFFLSLLDLFYVPDVLKCYDGVLCSRFLLSLCSFRRLKSGIFFLNNILVFCRCNILSYCSEESNSNFLQLPLFSLFLLSSLFLVYSDLSLPCWKLSLSV